MFSITTIIENSSSAENLAAEHGLSIFIENEDFQVLYDTGASPRFLKNAKGMGIDLTGVDALVLSHGHYDHTGGVISYLTEREKPQKIYLGKNFFEERYAEKKEGLLDISALIKEETLLKTGIPIQVVKEQPMELAKGIWLLSGFTPDNTMESLSPLMLHCTEKGIETDPFTDEVVIVLKTEKELVMISGCSHIGIVNMCSRVKRLFGQPITTFIGGTHLMEADEERIKYTCERLEKLGVKRLGACHCNGEKAGQYFEKHFQGFFRNQAGTKVIIK